jgi:hypothetical protein
VRYIMMNTSFTICVSSASVLLSDAEFVNFKTPKPKAFTNEICAKNLDFYSLPTVRFCLKFMIIQ